LRARGLSARGPQQFIWVRALTPGWVLNTQNCGDLTRKLDGLCISTPEKYRSSAKSATHSDLPFFCNRTGNLKIIQFMIRNLILAVPVVAMLWGCDKKEREALQAQNDSLRTELQASQATAE